ncbi:MAG: hypothetical protein CVV25_12120 [Ignavibacteriae bacterium HGW-Ignavibacteriae-4]|jgi:hypothetical protein|nr:MAG: hypothetical protein CVV25_12120 [Ignavibacteriae bacterium HGW-Ignavibacteriae-4]
MKKYIIVALCLAAVWGCSDDKVTTPDIVDKDTVDARFVTINGIIETDIVGNTNDTLGTYSIDDALCSNSEEYRIVAKPNISKVQTVINFNVLQPQEVEITLETALLSKSLKDSLISRGLGTYDDFTTFKLDSLFKEILEAGEHSLTIDLTDKPAGAYLVRVLREKNNDSCIPIIVTK